MAVTEIKLTTTDSQFYAKITGLLAIRKKKTNDLEKS